MQADRFTIKSQEALAAAQRLAGARSNPEVAPYHLLLALLEQGEGIVAPVLRRAGADPEAVRRSANQALDALPTVSGDSTAAPALGSELVELLQRADEEVLRSDLRVVASAGQPLRGGERLLGLDCESIRLHRKSKSVDSKVSDESRT